MRDWDEVDGSAPYIAGLYLMHRDKAVLYELVVSKNLWDRRIALVATLPMIRKGLIADTLKLVELVLGDEEDLIHKAGGWMLREVGKRDETALKNFLKRHHARMPRTMFRYAIERFPPGVRAKYLQGNLT
jgi:3-methyladenine DNA glycosylase AlkD